MKENNNKSKSIKYLIIGTLVLFLSVIGASMAYYLARVQGTLSGRAAGTELTINVEKISTNANMDLIPLDNDLETLNLAATGYQDNGACVDINGYSVCQIYKVTLTNNGSAPLTINGTVILSGQNVPNIDCARMNSATEVANNNSCMGGNVFVSGDTLQANSHNDYYVMVYINNLDETQTDSGEFNGTITFTTEDGRRVKGRFTKPFKLVNHITNLYNNAEKIQVTNNDINYNYAANVGLMNDRLGGTTESLDGGNIRFYGAEPNNYIDIGDRIVSTYKEGNWVKARINISDVDECLSRAQNNNWTDELINNDFGLYGINTVEELCSERTYLKGEPILWRIIGVFDGKLRIRRDDEIIGYAFNSVKNINNGNGLNQWGPSDDFEGADLMKLLNPGYENNKGYDIDGETLITVNNSLYWNSGIGNCYTKSKYKNEHCDFTNTGLSNEAKEFVINQTIYLGGFDRKNVFANEAYQKERGNDVFNNTKDCYGEDSCNDNITRTLSWTGKVGLIYPSDFGYAADFSDINCQLNLNELNNCSSNWMANGLSFTISPWSLYAVTGSYIKNGRFDGHATGYGNGGWPTLLLDSSVLAESGNGSKETPYVIAY